MGECSGFVFKGTIERKSKNKNKISKQRFFYSKVSLVPLFCFLTDNHRSHGGESRAPPLIRFPSLQKSFKGGKRKGIRKTKGF